MVKINLGRQIMKILLAVDGSDYSNAAVDAVAERPWPEGSVVQIISAIELSFTPSAETRSLPDSYYAQAERAAEEQAQSAAREALQRLRAGQALPMESFTTIRLGRAEDVILDEAEKWGADLIVLGSHGHRGFKRFLLASVSQAVATHAKCSVEIVRRTAAQ
jgi:nucleotide-binding universal stress UspA family protein